MDCKYNNKCLIKFLKVFHKEVLVISILILILFFLMTLAPPSLPSPITFSGNKKKVKPPRTLITEDGKVLNVNEAKYVRTSGDTESH